MRFAEAMGRINNILILGIVFFVLIFPIGLVRRAFAAGPLRRAGRGHTDSHRVTSARSTPESMEKLF